MKFEENLAKVLSKEEIDSLLECFNNEDTHALLVNTKKVTSEKLLELFPLLKPHPYVKDAFLYDKNIYQLGKSIYHELGYFYIQDPGAMLTASLIDFKEDDLVLDMCAAPGGKSIAASLKTPKGTIISNDISFSRAELIIQNAERLGLDHLVIINNDFEKIYPLYLNKFDVIILDAPCSGSGMFRKDKKMMDDWSINKVYKFAEIQKNLINIAYKMLKPGGILSYSTCSYSIEEDEEVVEYLLENSDATINPLPEIKEAYINKNKPIGIRTLPSSFYGEGQYICQIRKPGNPKPNVYNHNNKFRKLLPKCVEGYDVIKNSDKYYALKNGIDIKKLNVLRYGVYLGYEQKGVFHYDLHLAKALNKDDFPSIELNLNEVKSYLLGNVINKKNPHKGFVLLTHNNEGIDIAKTDGEIIKNNYPKGLRRNYQ